MYIYNTQFTDSNKIHSCLYCRSHIVDFPLESAVKPWLQFNHDLTYRIASQSALFPVNVLSLHMIRPTDKFTLVQTVH